MKRLTVSCLLAVPLLLFVGLPYGQPQTEDEKPSPDWVEYQDGEISVMFWQVPVELAVNVIQARTGFQIIVPGEAKSRTLSLYLTRVPVELAMRSLIASIGFNSFAMTYDRDGRPLRAIILEALPVAVDAAPADEQAPAEPPPLTVAEKNQLSASLKRWNELSEEARRGIQDRLRNLPPSEEREDLIKEYGRQVLGSSD
jgi:hypothetical protein